MTSYGRSSMHPHGDSRNRHVCMLLQNRSNPSGTTKRTQISKRNEPKQHDILNEPELRKPNEPEQRDQTSSSCATERTLSCGSVAWRWGAHPVHGVGARGRRSERTQGLSPSLSMIPPPRFF